MKNIYLLIISFSLISCYTYKVKAEGEEKPQEKRETPVKSATNIESIERSVASPQASLTAIESAVAQKSKIDRNKTKAKAPTGTGIEAKLEPSKFYKIEAAGRSHKIQVDKWESDTLVAHVIHKPKKILKFHKNQINQSTIAERQFSNPTADIITVAAYASVGVGIYLLVK
ncbi:hypothetical protein [Chryseobacterium sp. FH1]|uniref:hypothetical protein n=1 Tax=Chryseobacterium sp. FH1 TaxID=1233951 RepID=UPI0004E31019|nr:hypothetical protein [Chryseobacterium sp. FH1]KFC24162.1 hypothetical protein IO90_02325 [Chryseobacterium sp. FH1]